jgi:4-amino-4-deoxy-L-arabinose transferase-like glycosyltransferase
MNKKILLLSAVVILSFVLRFWQLGKLPPGFYSDEALYGYEAYSLLKTGRDQFGTLHPLSIAGFGDFRPALYIYATIPFIASLGLTEFATRLPSALSSIATIIVTFFLIKELTKNYRAAFFGSFVLAISPWSLYFGRMAHETNLMTLLISLGVYFLVKNQRVRSNVFLKTIFFVAAMYTYHSARVFVPLFLIWAVFIFRDQVLQNIKVFTFGLVLFIVLLVPLTSELNPSQGLSRIEGVSFWTDPGLNPYINQLRGSIGSRLGSTVSKFVINKLTVYPAVFVRNYLTHFSPQFLLTQGDPNGIYNTPAVGILLWIEPILFVIGAAGLYKKNRKFFWLIIGGVLIALIPDSLTRFAPSSARIHLILPFLAVLSGVGLSKLIRKNYLINSVIVFLIILNSLWFWHQYILQLPITNERAWQIGTDELITKTNRLANNYDKVWMSRNCWGWIHVIFNTHYDPATFQSEARHSERNDLGFWWVSDFGKYHLENFPKEGPFASNTLYTGTPEEFPLYTKPLETVVSPYTHHTLFWLVDGGHIPGHD